MANEFARNIQDAGLNPAAFALPTTLLAAGQTVSATVDLGADVYDTESLEVEISVPALSATIAPAAATVGVTYMIQDSASSTFNGFRSVVSQTIVGSAGGVAATVLRGRLPSNCGRYLRAVVQLSATCTDASAVSGTFTLRF